MEQFARTLLATALASVPVLSMAANGTITFTGKVIEQTCQVQVDGKDSTTVDLPTVSTGQLKVLGDTAGLKAFKVSVSGCTVDNTKDVAINTVFWGAPVTSNNNLKNTHPTNPAANVEVELLKDSSGVEKIKMDSVTSVAGLNLVSGAQDATHEFAARYFATGQAGAGDVMAVVNYDITYQ